MNLHAKLMEREAAGRPVRVGLIGAGKFGTMFLAQVRRTPGMHLVGLADLNVERARNQLRSCGWSEPQFAAADLGDALRSGRTLVTADAEALIAFADIDVMIEATGDPSRWSEDTTSVVPVIASAPPASLGLQIRARS